MRYHYFTPAPIENLRVESRYGSGPCEGVKNTCKIFLLCNVFPKSELWEISIVLCGPHAFLFILASMETEPEQSAVGHFKKYFLK